MLTSPIEVFFRNACTHLILSHRVKEQCQDRKMCLSAASEEEKGETGEGRGGEEGGWRREKSGESSKEGRREEGRGENEMRGEGKRWEGKE